MRFRNGDSVRVIGREHEGRAVVIGIRPNGETLIRWRTGQWRRTAQWFDDELLQRAEPLPKFQNRRQTL